MEISLSQGDGAYRRIDDKKKKGTERDLIIDEIIFIMRTVTDI